MRHGLRLSKLGRPTAHRVLMLRNLVSSLLEHEQVSTTLAKAKAAQKLADQLIQWGKSGTKSDWERANAFLLNAPKTLRPLFTTLASRYATRPGGYTRIHRAGFRVGDRAPLAVLELVDNKNDLRFEGAAKALGREVAVLAREAEARSGEEEGKRVWGRVREVLEAEEGGAEGLAGQVEKLHGVDALTRKNIVKALRYRAAPVPVDASSVPSSSPTESVPEADADLPTASSSSSEQQTTLTATPPSELFLARAHYHYLSSLASFTLARAPTPDPLRSIKQLTQRLGGTTVYGAKGAPREVRTVPTVGRRERAGERVDGWEKAGEEVGKRGGPISRAKGGKGRESRARGRKEVEAEVFKMGEVGEALPQVAEGRP
ncbi:hypothetical protein JCM6882_008095 [Rhodosporidiobolus microsporus]